MVTAAWHLLITAWSHAVGLFGSPLSFGVASLGLLVVIVMAIGLQADRPSWPVRIVWGAGIVLLVWAALTQWSAVAVVYDDHRAFVALAKQRLASLDALQSKDRVLWNRVRQLDTQVKQGLVAKGVTTQTSAAGGTGAPAGRDPAALYQHDQKVADTTGVRIDGPNGIIWFDRVTTSRYINFDRPTEFRAFALQSCSIEAKSSELAANSAAVTVYLGVVCQIDPRR
jgi:hypothetical protein